MSAPEVVVAYAHSRGAGWFKAEMGSAWRPTYCGASRRTRYYERRGRAYVEVAWDAVPPGAYRRLRAQLRGAP